MYSQWGSMQGNGQLRRSRISTWYYGGFSPSFSLCIREEVIEPYNGAYDSPRDFEMRLNMMENFKRVSKTGPTGRRGLHFPRRQLSYITLTVELLIDFVLPTIRMARSSLQCDSVHQQLRKNCRWDHYCEFISSVVSITNQYKCFWTIFASESLRSAFWSCLRSRRPCHCLGWEKPGRTEICDISDIRIVYQFYYSDILRPQRSQFWKAIYFKLRWKSGITLPWRCQNSMPLSRCYLRALCRPSVKIMAVRKRFPSTLWCYLLVSRLR